jgi:hypothetical protein
MKVAVILTGHMRCWRDVLPNFKEKIVDRYQPDVFIHTWNEEGWWIPGDKQNAKGYFEETPKVTHPDMLMNYMPKELMIEDWEGMNYNKIFEQRGELYENFAHRPKNILSMFYKLHAGVGLMEKYAAKTGAFYDLVIRMRPDMILNEDLPDFDSNLFYTLAHRNHLGQGTGDMIQVGNMFNMIMFSKAACYLTHIYLKTGLLCPHVLSTQWIKDMGIPWQEFSINKTLQHTPKGEYVEMDKQ